MLYLILHGIVAGKKHQGFVTHDVDFFLGRNYLVTVHHAAVAVDRGGADDLRAPRRTCSAKGRAACCTASSIGWSTTTARKSTRSRSGSSSSSSAVFEPAEAQPAARHPAAQGATSRRCGASTLPQRDAIGRLARREFPQISETLSYRFRDVYDHLVRLTDEALFLQDRVTGLLDALPVDAVEPAESGHEGADRDRDDLHAADGAHRHVRHERRRCRTFPAAIAAQFWWVVGIMVGDLRRACSGCSAGMDWL